MSKRKLRVAALLALVAAIITYPMSVLFVFPWASNIALPDGQRVAVSLSAGTWVFPVATGATVILLLLAIGLYWRSLSAPIRPD